MESDKDIARSGLRASDGLYTLLTRPISPSLARPPILPADAGPPLASVPVQCSGRPPVGLLQGFAAPGVWLTAGRAAAVTPGDRQTVTRRAVSFGVVPPPLYPTRRVGRTPFGAARQAEVLVVAAFSVAIVLLSLGAWTVWRAGARHRATADETLRDHASYIANMIASTVYSQGWFSVQSLLHAWRETLDGNTAWPATDSVVARATHESVEPEMTLLAPSLFFVGDRAGWRTTDPRSGAIDPVLRDATRRLTDSVPSDKRFRLLFEPNGPDTTLLFVVGMAHPVPGKAWYGVAIPLADLRTKLMKPRIATLARSFGVLRDSLKQQPFTDSIPPLAISIEAPNHQVMYATPARPHEPWLGSFAMHGDLPADVIVSVEPAAVSVLMSYGYPADTGGRVLLAYLAGLLLLGGAALFALRTLELSRRREEFTSSVSHELRNRSPISSCSPRHCCSIGHTPEERQSSLKTITRETRRLVHMVENVLALSRVAHPSDTVLPRPERIDRLVHDVLSSFEPLFKTHDIQVEVVVEGPTPPPWTAMRSGASS